METERAAKLRRLNQMRRSLPYVSASALSSVLQDVEEQGVPELHGRKHMKEASEKALADHNAYGDLIDSIPMVHKDGGTKMMLVINFLSVLQAAFYEGEGFCQLILDALKTSPCSIDAPWDLIYYTDEVTPGNPLSAETSRKIQMAYLSFLQLGAVALSKEESWFCVLAKRSSIVADMEAGMSQVTKGLLKYIFKHPACDVQQIGLLLKAKNGAKARLYFKLGIFLQDGAAHKHVFSCKGDAGTKFCLLCTNLVSAKSGLADQDGEDLLTCSSYSLNEIVLATDSDIAGTCQRLLERHATMSKTDFTLWQQAVGFTFNSHALLFDNEMNDIVKPISQFLHDWMHMILVKGVFQTILHLLMSTLKDHKVDAYTMFSQCVELWHLPSAKSDNLKVLFSKKRKDSNNEANTFKCTASEGLSMYPILAYFVQHVLMVSGLCQPECKAFLLLADVMDMLASVHMNIITPDMLQRSIDSFLQACIACGWGKHLHQKFHWVLHLPSHLHKFKLLPACWVQERKHKCVKRYSTAISNTTIFERSVLAEVICHDLAAIQDPLVFKEGPRLLKNSKVTKKMKALLESMGQNVTEDCYSCATAVLHPAGLCHKGDVVLMRGPSQVNAGQVWIHAFFNGVCMTLMSKWKLISYNASNGFAVFKQEDHAEFVATLDIYASTTWSVHEPTVCKVLVPLAFRN